MYVYYGTATFTDCEIHSNSATYVRPRPRSIPWPPWKYLPRTDSHVRPATRALAPCSPLQWVCCCQRPPTFHAPMEDLSRN